MKRLLFVFIMLWMMIPAQVSAHDKVVLIPSVQSLNFGQSFSISVTVRSDEFDIRFKLDQRFTVTSISSRECELTTSPRLAVAMCKPVSGVAQFTLQLRLPEDVYGGDSFNMVEIYDYTDNQVYTSENIRIRIPDVAFLTLLPPSTPFFEGEEAIFTAVIRPDREMNLALRTFDSELKGVWNHFSVTIHETESIPIPVSFSECGHTTVMLFLFDNDVYDDAYITSAQVGVDIVGCKVYLPGVFND